MMSGNQIYRHIKALLLKAGTPEPGAKAQVIIAHLLQIGLCDVFLQKNIDSNTALNIEYMARRCASGEPVEYVTGKAYFRKYVLDVSPAVLIPRHETELVAETATELINTKGYKTALDLCTGSGCIAIALAAETAAEIDACDISKSALKTAQANAQTNNVHVNFFKSDMFSMATKTYDIIVCNPPYVSEEEYAGLEKSVRLYEPKIALLAGNGLDFFRIIAGRAARYLNPKGALVLEIGANQADGVMELLSKGGFFGISTKKDYSGRDRIVTAYV